MRKIPLSLAALGLAALAAGCGLPPYNEELSLAQVTRAKLGTPVNRIGPVYAQLEEGGPDTKFYFLPDRDDPANSGGFLVAETSYGLRAWYLADYSMGLEASWSIAVDNASETSNNFLLQPVDSGAVDANYYLILTRYLQDDLRLIYSSGTSAISQPTTEVPLISSLPSAMNVLGSNIFADTTSGSDLQFFLAVQSTSYAEYSATTDTADGFGTLLSSGLPLAAGLLPGGLTDAFYAHDPVLDRSYLSYLSGSSYLTFAWTWNHEATIDPPGGFQPLTGVKGRVEAVLNNGQLLTLDKGTGRVYNPAGGQLYEFPLGDLKFCFERWDSGAGRYLAYFSLAYWIWGREDKSDELRIEVYAIPSDSLGKLN
jgi:hypothetical protein